MARVGIIGASGFTGAELLRLCAVHPELEVVLATGDTQAGTPVGRPLPEPGRGLPGPRVRRRTTRPPSPASTSCSSACPTGPPRRSCPTLLGKVAPLVDLAADFRLRDAGLYPRWYGEAHTAPELLAEFAYGLPELFRDEMQRPSATSPPPAATRRRRLAGPGPARAGRRWSSRRASSSTPPSGVSGAGRPPKANTTFCTVDEDFTAYGLLDHRHTPGDRAGHRARPGRCSPPTWPR